MSDETLTNAAVEWIKFMIDVVNLSDRPAEDFGSSAAVSDAVFVDRRTGGMNYGTIEGVSGIRDWLASTWDVGSGRPRWSMPDVVDVRGERCAAVVFVLDYGNDMFIDGIFCLRLDRDLQRALRAVQFDVDAVGDAVALLDDWHAEIDD